jgi:hypothetical protein
MIGDAESAKNIAGDFERGIVRLKCRVSRAVWGEMTDELHALKKEEVAVSAIRSLN